MQGFDNRQVIYLYDLPKHLVTSVRIAQIIKDKSGYELLEPVQFREARANFFTGLPSPFMIGFIKVDQADAARVAQAIKYFDFNDGQGNIWHCRALPFDRDLLGANKVNTNLKLTVFVKNIPVEYSHADLENYFKQVGPVKSAKISLGPQKKRDESGRVLKEYDNNLPPVSNGFGFVCFENEESAQKAVEVGKVRFPKAGGADIEVSQYDESEIIKYVIKERNDFKKAFNNLYVKGFPTVWTEENIRGLFSQYGNIKSLAILTKKDKDGQEKPFAFVCYDKEGDTTYGQECANKAVEDLHGKEFEGQKIYVQPALPAQERKAQLAKEQLRFKNSKKKCNLYVKNFPAEWTPENLQELFQNFGPIESIKMLPPLQGRGTTRAFVCYKSPDHAAQARASLHGYQVGPTQLIVTNYELPEVRQRMTFETKDKADFAQMKSQTPAALDPSVLQRPDTMQLIQTILDLFKRSLGQRSQPGSFRHNQFSQQQQNRGPRGPSAGPQGQQQQQQYRGPPPARPPQQIMAPAQPQVGAPQQTAAPQVIISGMSGNVQGPLPSTDPVANQYNIGGFNLWPAIDIENPNYKNMAGEYIYDYVNRMVGEEKAGKITGLLIDLSIDEIKGYLYDFNRLLYKVGEANNFLLQVQAAQAAQGQATR